MKEQPDLLNGSIAPKLMAFAIPLAMTSILQQLFNAADIAVIGQFAGKHAMAAVGCNSPVIALTVNLFVGVSIGANVIIANFTGQQDERRIRESVHTAMVLAIICGVFVTCVGQIIARPMINLLDTPAVIAPMAVKYLRIYFMGMIFIMLYNFEAAIFRSQGDTGTPLRCLMISGILNVILNLFFVIVLKMDVAGVALATVLSNGVSAGLLLWHLCRAKSAVRLQKGSFRLEGSILKDILRIGVPSGLQGVVFSVSNLVIQSAINSLGPDVVAGSAAAFNMEVLGYYILNSFAQAAVTFVGQNYGAGNLPRCRKITRQALILDEVCAMSVAALLIIFGHRILMLFNPDPAVIHFGYIRATILLSTQALNVVNEVLSGAMRGYGISMVPAAVTFIGVCGTRILWVYTVFRHSHTWYTLMAVYPVSWLITMVVMIAAYFISIKKIRIRLEASGDANN